VIAYAAQQSPWGPTTALGVFPLSVGTPRLPTPRAGPCRYGWFGVVGLAVDFAKLIADETEKWGNFIRALNIKAE